MNGKQKDVSIHNQPIKEKLSEKRVKRILEFKSSIEEFFPSNYSLHFSL